VLLAFAGERNQDIASQVKLGRNEVGKWRRRWRDAWEQLTRWECLEAHRLREAIREVFRDAPRPGSPGTFTAEQIAQILAVACEPPEKSDRPITHWTRRELTDEVVKRGIVESISESSVGRLLNQAALKPHRRKMWLNTKEKDPEVFQRQVEAVCETYRDAPQLSAERGVHTISTDEMTGLQALERNAPSQPLRPHQPARDEYEYTRHGTTTLIGNLDVVTGEITTPTIGPTRTEEDFVTHIEATIASDPTGEWVFVMDNLNIHASASLVTFVAKACGMTAALGKKTKPASSKIKRRVASSCPAPAIASASYTCPNTVPG
jgi:transposase